MSDCMDRLRQYKHLRLVLVRLLGDTWKSQEGLTLRRNDWGGQVFLEYVFCRVCMHLFFAHGERNFEGDIFASNVSVFPPTGCCPWLVAFLHLRGRVKTGRNRTGCLAVALVPLRSKAEKIEAQMQLCWKTNGPWWCRTNLSQLCAWEWNLFVCSAHVVLPAWSGTVNSLLPTPGDSTFLQMFFQQNMRQDVNALTHDNSSYGTFHHFFTLKGLYILKKCRRRVFFVAKLFGSWVASPSECKSPTSSCLCSSQCCRCGVFLHGRVRGCITKRQRGSQETEDVVIRRCQWKKRCDHVALEALLDWVLQDLNGRRLSPKRCWKSCDWRLRPRTLVLQS